MSSDKRSHSHPTNTDKRSHDSYANTADCKRIKSEKNYVFTGHIEKALISSKINQLTVVVPHQIYSDEQIKNFCKELEKLLKENADVLSCYDVDYIPVSGQTSRYVPIEIYHESSQTDVSGDYSVQFEEFFEEAFRYASREAKKWENIEMKNQHQLIHGNIVGLCGPSGSGKTTITRQIVRQILDKNLYNIKFIFYIKLRDICYSRETTLLRLLLSSSNFSWQHKPEKDNSILKIINQSDDVIIILDGLNEATFINSSVQVRHLDMFDQAKPEYLIKNLLSGNILPNAKKLVTSRPQQIFQLHHEHQPSFILNIRGLSKESQLEMCRSVCIDKCQAGKVYDCISSDPKLTSFCRNPISCSMIAYCLKRQLQNNSDADLSAFITYIVALVLNSFIQNDHLSDDFTYTSLADLAWNGILSNSHYYSKEKLTTASISTEQLDTFFMVSEEHSEEPKAKFVQHYSFAHSIFQEFFAAYKLRFQASAAELKQVVEHLFEIRLESVAKFLFGMFNETTSKAVSLLEQPYDDSSEHHEKLEILKNFAINCLKRVLEEKPRHSLSYFLRICNCAYELHDDQFVKSIALVLGTSFNITGDIFPSDVAALHYVLQAIQYDKFSLSLGPCLTFRENCLRMFFQELHSTLRSEKLFLAKVDLSRNKVGDDEMEMICACLHKIQILCLTDCKLDTSQVKVLSDQLNKFPYILSELNMSYNDLDDKSAGYLAKSLHKVDSLHVSNCNFTSSAFEQISKAINARDRPLKHFCTAKNITTEKLQSLSKCISKVKALVLGFRHENHNVATGIDALTSAISALPEPMEKLCFRGSHIGDEGLISVSKCLANIKNLRLGNSYDNNLTSFGIQELATAFSKLTTPMEEFVFICPTEYTVEINTEFSYCSDKIKKLDIR